MEVEVSVLKNSAPTRDEKSLTSELATCVFVKFKSLLGEISLSFGLFSFVHLPSSTSVVAWAWLFKTAISANQGLICD